MALNDDYTNPPLVRYRKRKPDKWYRERGLQPPDPTEYVPRHNGTRYFDDEDPDE